MAIEFRKGMVQQFAGISAAVLLALGVIGTQDAKAQVVMTKHNLSAVTDANLKGWDSTDGSAQTRRNKADAGNQVCVFCHTPHGAATAKAPLWQRTVEEASTYKTYSSTAATKSPTMDYDPSAAGAAAIGSVSIACLSCHDGTQAINMLANTPGSGTASDGKVAGFADSTSLKNGMLVGTWNLGGDGSGTDGITAGTDLRNDHPIGIPYSGGVTGTTLTDVMFRPVTKVTGKDVWYVDVAPSGSITTRGTAGSKDKYDIALFTRDDVTVGGVSGKQPMVECSSCHDPHMNTELFLRQPADNSAICLACHIK